MAYLNAKITLMNLALANLQPRLDNQLVFEAFDKFRTRLCFHYRLKTADHVGLSLRSKHWQ